MKANDPRHGTRNGYANLGCRCDACRKANTAYHKAHNSAGYKRDRCACGALKHAVYAQCWACYVASVGPPEHGTESRYTSRRWRCRCAACRTAAKEARQRRREADPEASRQYDRDYARRYRARRQVAA